ncbi:unnamed protein product [Cuscuta campestris]|uniref:Suppressor of forked domain-containing protein n=1 Tax=Cuscuta campestris TaxID=132261 RepID=A0A484MDK2_9ASTE|nr:unnamed protein product [Cuscuta campestris]
MADQDTMVTQSSTAVGYKSADCNDASNVSGMESADNHAVHDTAVGTEHLGPHTAIGDSISSASPGDSTQGSAVAAANLTDSTQQEIPTVLTYDAVKDVAGQGDSSQDTMYAASINENNSEARDIAFTSITENGILSDSIHNSATMHQPVVDDSALSPEEERLWNIVRANSLDFGAWTALIEETEKIPEGNILKIRKVYDAFLAEFPLCYGYWKKYADHEARIGSMDKVVEVYERAVQGVTYSVDMWLHYCVFAINTYGDPETIRSILATVQQLFHIWRKGLLGMHNSANL